MNDESPELPALVSGGQVRGIIPQTFDEAWRIANAVCMAGMAPYGLNTPEKATIAIMHGLEVGMAPMIALQSIASINGSQPSTATARWVWCWASGKLETIKEGWRARATTAWPTAMSRRGDPEPKVGKFSVADAKKAKLWMKKGHKGEDTPWVTYEERMLKMRARAFALRDGFADVLKGLAIVEEIRDIDNDVSAPKRQPPARAEPHRLRGKSQKAKKSTPPAPPKPAPKKEPEPEPESFDEETGENTYGEEVRQPNC